MLAATLATIHNERFTVRLVDTIRAALVSGDFDDCRTEVLGRFYGRVPSIKSDSHDLRRPTCPAL